MRTGWSRASCAVAGLVFLLGGCAASTPTLGPAEYPFHSVAPQIEIHWRLNVESNRVQADGLLERERETQIREAWLQLLGIDATGRTISFTPPVRFLWRSPSTLEPFTVCSRLGAVSSDTKCGSIPSSSRRSCSSVTERPQLPSGSR